MKWFLDTEFYERGHRGKATIELISIGLVGSDGTELYAENAEFDWGTVEADHWLQDNVRPHLSGMAFSPEEIRDVIVQTVGPKPDFWGWYCDYDWVVLCSLFGRMVDLPSHFPRFCRDLKQLTKDRHIDAASLPEQDGTEHNALDDARWNKLVYEHIRDREAS